MDQFDNTTTSNDNELLQNNDQIMIKISSIMLVYNYYTDKQSAR